MTIERAIEILNPEHREHYESLEPVNEACRMGMDALKKQIPKKAKESHSHIRYVKIYECPNCKGEFSGKVSKYCYHCGQALDWSEE